jgi:hypothetical protein
MEVTPAHVAKRQRAFNRLRLAVSCYREAERDLEDAKQGALDAGIEITDLARLLERHNRSDDGNTKPARKV